MVQNSTPSMCDTPIIFLSFYNEPNGQQSLLSASLSKNRVRESVVSAIHKGDMSYKPAWAPEWLSKIDQIRNFRRDFEQQPRKVVNSGLQGGRLDICIDGEEY